MGSIETKPPPFEETNDTNTIRDQKASSEQHCIRNAMNDIRGQSGPPRQNFADGHLKPPLSWVKVMISENISTPPDLRLHLA